MDTTAFRNISLLTLIAMLAVGSAAWAQTDTTSLRGRRVRLTVPCVTCSNSATRYEFYVGDVVAVTDGVWILRDGRIERRVPAASVTRIHVSKRSNRYALEGGVTGLVAGGLAGFVLTCSAMGCGGDGWGRLRASIAAGALGGLGLLLGSAIGGSYRSDEWIDVSRAGPHMTYDPRTRRFSAGVSIGW